MTFNRQAVKRALINNETHQDGNGNNVSMVNVVNDAVYGARLESLFISVLKDTNRDLIHDELATIVNKAMDNILDEVEESWE